MSHLRGSEVVCQQSSGPRARPVPAIWHPVPCHLAPFVACQGPGSHLSGHPTPSPRPFAPPTLPVMANMLMGHNRQGPYGINVLKHPSTH